MDIVLPKDALWTPPREVLLDTARELERRYKRWWLTRERANVVEAIGTPTSIGSLAQAGLATTIVMTCSAAVAAGQKVIVVAGSAGTAGLTYTFSSSPANTWVTDVTQAGATGIAIGSSEITTPLTTSSTITCTFSTTTASRLILALQVSGLLAASPLDKVISATGTAVGWSTGATAATTQADELIIAACANDSTATETDTPGATYTELFDFANTTAAELTMLYKIVAATGAQTGSGTWTNSGTRTWAAAVATYKGAGAAPAALPGRRLIRLQSVCRAATR